MPFKGSAKRAKRAKRLALGVKLNSFFDATLLTQVADVNLSQLSILGKSGAAYLILTDLDFSRLRDG